MVTFPVCKINLGLQILSRREDGFHNIRTCFYPIRCSDVLELLPASQFSFTQTGIQIPGLGEDNLCVKAYRLLAEEYTLPPITIHLHKLIPPGAGLGGGSSNATHTLRVIRQVFDLNLTDEKLAAHALFLGSDCPFFLRNEPMLAEGRGEILSPVSINVGGLFLVVVKPAVHVLTAAAYANVGPVNNQHDLREILGAGIETWSKHLHNNFEPSVFQRYPVIREIKEKLGSLGALYASMSGSGSAVFGIFDRRVSWQAHFPGLWGWSQRL